MARKFIKSCYTLVALLVFVGSIHVEAKELTEEQRTQLFEDLKQCKNSTDLSDDEFETIIAKKELPTSEAGKCFTKCLMEKLDIIEDAEGGKKKISVITMQASLEENMEKEDDIAKGKDIIQKCGDTVEPEDSCAYAYNISKCIYDRMKEAGISQ
uniref:Odorant-binding protein 27 n=1 Tax=Apolygus lucorum TaxID=248454 RepID=A0A142FH94_APOLU|nr:odorant-binding protein 27 [Apolygus lucorum]